MSYKFKSVKMVKEAKGVLMDGKYFKELIPIVRKLTYSDTQGLVAVVSVLMIEIEILHDEISKLKIATNKE